MTDREIKIWGTVGLAIIIFLMVWMFTSGNCNQQKVVAPIDSTTFWKNKFNQAVASQKGFTVQFQLKEKRMADSLAAIYNTKAKWLQEWILAFTETKADIPPVDKEPEIEWDPPILINNMECPPQVKRMRQSFKNKWYDINVQIGDSNYLHLVKRDSITVLWKIVKEGKLFNRRTLLQLDVSLADTNTKVNQIKAYRAGPIRPKRMGVGIQAGYQLQGLKIRPYVGIGVSYNFIRL